MFIRSGYSAQTRSVSGTQDHYFAADVVVGRGHRASLIGSQSSGCGLALELGGDEAVEMDHVVFNCVSAFGRDRLAPALEQKAVVDRPHCGRLARVDDAVEFA